MVLTALAAGALPARAAAQGSNPVVSGVVPEDASDTIDAKIHAIDRLARQVTLAAVDGRTLTVVADAKISLDRFKIGQEVVVRYYRAVAFVVSKRMEAPRGTTQLPPDQAALLARYQQARMPDGTMVSLKEITGLVVGVRPAANTVDVVNPTGGGVYTIQVDDPDRATILPLLRVGDTVTAIASPPIAGWMEPLEQGAGVQVGNAHL